MWPRAYDFPTMMDMGQWHRISPSFLNCLSQGVTATEKKKTKDNKLSNFVLSQPTCLGHCRKDGIISIKHPTVSKRDRYLTMPYFLPTLTPAVSYTPENISRGEPMGRCLKKLHSISAMCYPLKDSAKWTFTQFWVQILFIPHQTLLLGVIMKCDSLLTSPCFLCLILS